MKANITKKTWLGRELSVETKAGSFTVLYDAADVGFEKVLVNNEVVVKVRSWFILVPRIEFFIGPHTAVIEVKPSLLLSIRSFKLIVDGEILYSE